LRLYVQNEWVNCQDVGRCELWHLHNQINTRIKIVNICETVLRTCANNVCLGIDTNIVYFAVVRLDALQKLELYMLWKEINAI